MKSMMSVILGMIMILSSSCQESESISLKANVAKVKLTPPLEMNYALGGYGARMSKPAEGIHDDIWVKTVVLTAGEKKYALITMDILALPPNVKPAVIKALGDESWKMDNIMILPSHSHASLDMTALNDKNTLNNPYLGIYQPKLLQFVVEKIVSSIKSASQNQQPVLIDTKRNKLEGLNRNRRNDGVVDRDLTITRIDRKNGIPMAVLVNWTAHPTFMDDADMLVSGGWPGYLQRELETWIGEGILCMYYNGAQGDLTILRGPGGSRFEQAEEYGRKIARHAFNLYTGMRPTEKSQFHYHAKLIQLPEPKMHPMFRETGGEEYGMDDKTSNHLLTHMCPRQCVINALRIGELVIVGAPGELTAVLGEEIKKDLSRKGILFPAIGGMANEWLSYITSREQYQAGGYETSVSFYGPDFGSVVSKAMIETSLILVK